jgi:hypothetical protein
MKTFQQFISEREGDFGSPPLKTKLGCKKTVKYPMAPGGKACAGKSSSSKGGD